MSNIKYTKKSKYLIGSVVLLMFAILILVVNTLGTTFAWFTDSSTLDFEGDTATVAIKQYYGASEINSAYNIELTSSSSTSTTVKNTGVIDEYIRVKITCNWENNNAEYGNVGNFVTLGIDSSKWYIPTNAINDFIYYKGAVASNETKTVMSSITISSIPDGAGKVVVNVWAEAVQANDYGLTAFLPNLPTGTTLSDFKTALGIGA